MMHGMASLSQDSRLTTTTTNLESDYHHHHHLLLLLLHHPSSSIIIIVIITFLNIYMNVLCVTHLNLTPEWAFLDGGVCVCSIILGYVEAYLCGCGQL